MTRDNETRQVARFTRQAVLPLSATMLLASLAQAQDWPALKKGRWDITRAMTAGPAPSQTSSYKECADPTPDMRNTYNDFARRCETSPVARSGGTYRYTTLCASPGGKVKSKYTITVESDSAYKMQIDVEQGGVKLQSLITARYLGSC